MVVQEKSTRNDFGQSEMINKQVPVNLFSQATFETWLESWWKRGLITLAFGLISGIVISYLDQSSMDGTTFSYIAIISIILGVFGVLFYPHRISYILLALLVVVGAVAWFPLVDSVFFSLWLGFGSAIIVSAIISRVLHAMKKI